VKRLLPLLVALATAIALPARSQAWPTAGIKPE